MAYCNLFLADRLAVGLETYSRTPCQKSLDFLHHCKQSLHRIELLHNPYLNFDNNFNKNGYQTKLFCVRCNILEFLIWHDLPERLEAACRRRPRVCRPLCKVRWHSEYFYHWFKLSLRITLNKQTKVSGEYDFPSFLLSHSSLLYLQTIWGIHHTTIVRMGHFYKLLPYIFLIRTITRVVS